MIRLEGEDISLGLSLNKVEQGLDTRILVEELWDIGTCYQHQLFQSLHLGPLKQVWIHSSLKRYLSEKPSKIRELVSIARESAAL